MFSDPAKLVHRLLILLCAILTFFGAASLSYLTQNPEYAIFQAVYAFLMFLEAALVLACAYWFTKNARVYWLAVILLTVNAISVIFDQLGWIDVLFALFNLAILFLLLLHRKTFIPQP